MHNEIEFNHETGLLFVSEVPFTQETIEACQNTIDYGKSLPKGQFQCGIVIVDNVNGGAVIVGEQLLHAIKEFITDHHLVLAHNQDFA